MKRKRIPDGPVSKERRRRLAQFFIGAGHSPAEAAMTVSAMSAMKLRDLCMGLDKIESQERLREFIGSKRGAR